MSAEVYVRLVHLTGDLLAGTALFALGLLLAFLRWGRGASTKKTGGTAAAEPPGGID